MMDGRTFSPASIPPSISAPAPIRTWVEFTSSISETDFKITTVQLISDKIKTLYGLNPHSTLATNSFTFKLHSISLWLIPDKNDAAFGEFTVQLFDAPFGGNTILRQLQGYGSRDRAARIGYEYPHAVQQLPISDGSTASLMRAKHSSRSAGDQDVLVRVFTTIVPYGGDVQDNEE